MVTNLGINVHVGVPTQGNTDVHEGMYPYDCEPCQARLRGMARAPSILGPDGEKVELRLGLKVRVVPQMRHGRPEWGHIIAMLVNQTTGQVCMALAEYPSTWLLTAADLMEAA